MNSNRNELSRRTFLTRTIQVIGGAIGVTLLFPLVKYSVSPALQKGGANWQEVGPVKDIKVDSPTRITYNLERKDGWVQKTDVKTAWVVRHADNTFDVFDPKCTHLGCPFFWDESSKSFLCPCHTAIFDITGKVVTGPPPRPLDKYQYKVEKDTFYVLEESPNAAA